MKNNHPPKMTLRVLSRLHQRSQEIDLVDQESLLRESSVNSHPESLSPVDTDSAAAFLLLNRILTRGKPRDYKS